jgi:hypothetical protein
MASIVRRISPLADWAIALVAGVAIYVVHVTKVGSPLVGLSTGPTTPGISQEAKTTFYGALVVAGAVFAAVGFVITALAPRTKEVGALVARSFGGLMLAGIAGLLLDYKDGPVDSVHLLVYVVLVLSVVRFVRIAAILSSSLDDEPATMSALAATSDTRGFSGQAQQ